MSYFMGCFKFKEGSSDSDGIGLSYNSLFFEKLQLILGGMDPNQVLSFDCKIHYQQDYLNNSCFYVFELQPDSFP